MINEIKCKDGDNVKRVTEIQHKDGEVRKVYCNEVLDGWVKDKYIPCDKTAGQYVDVSNPHDAGNSVACFTTDCQIGDKFTITLKGDNSGRAWCFVDKDNYLVDKSNPTVTATNLEITAPCDGKVILHNQYSAQPNPSVKKLSKIWYPHGLVDIGANQSFSWVTGKYIDVGSTAVGSVVAFTETDNASAQYSIVSVKVGDVLKLTCKGATSARSYAILDNQRKLIRMANANYLCDNETINIEHDGYLIAQNWIPNAVTASLVRTNAHTYPTIKIGTREWLGANLDETLGRIQEDEFYYNNDKFTYGKYGKLYKWGTLCSANETHSTALAGILPNGWRLAKKADFDALIALDGTGSLFRDEHFNNGSNNSNMSLLAGGLRNNNEAFDLVGQSGYCWSSSKLTTYATRFIVNNNAISVNDGGSSLVGAYNVRLVRDLPVDQVSMVSLGSPNNDEPSTDSSNDSSNDT